MTQGESGVTKTDKYQWEASDGTVYQLTDIPTSPCHKCGGEIEDGTYCYFRDGPRSDGAGMDHVCWDCGKEVTGFGDE